METKVSTSLENQQDQTLQPWHKPELLRLTVTLDTSLGTGSRGDGDGSEFSIGISDQRLKKDISKLQDTLQGILSLNGVTYHYDTANHPEMGLSDKPQIGFIAQELEEVYPQLVVTKENGYKAVNYAPMVAVLVEAIKEQQEMIEDLQRQVNRLQEKSKEATN